jgi:hypothetical protein
MTSKTPGDPQKYRLTPAGERALRKATGGN